MRDASPAFQNDGAFQFAEDAGFQTQTPVWGGTLGLVAGLDSPTRHAPSGRPYAVIGELAVVVGLASRTRGPRRPSGGRIAWRPGRYFQVVGDLGVVVALRARSADPLAIEDEQLILLLGASGAASPRPLSRADRERDDEDVLILRMAATAGERRAAASPSTSPAIWLVLDEEEQLNPGIS